MKASDKPPEAKAVPAGQKPDEPKRVLWRFAELNRKVGLGPNRAIIGDD